MSKKRRLLVALALVVVAGVIGGIFFRDKFNVATTHREPTFTFAAASFPDWATAGNIYNPPGTVDAEGNKVPVASIIVSQCKPGSNCSRLVEVCRHGEQCDTLQRLSADGCFVSVAYTPGNSLDPEVMVAERIKRDTNFDGVSAREVGVREAKMMTSSGVKNYRIHLFDIDQAGDEYKRGNAFGYLSLEGGYVEVQSVCQEASQLGETLPALQAIQFNDVS